MRVLGRVKELPEFRHDLECLRVLVGCRPCPSLGMTWNVGECWQGVGNTREDVLLAGA